MPRLNAYASMKELAKAFGVTIPKVKNVLIEAGVLGGDGKPLEKHLASGLVKPLNLSDGTPWFKLKSDEASKILVDAGCQFGAVRIRNAYEAVDFLDDGVVAIGQCLGFKEGTRSVSGLSREVVNMIEESNSHDAHWMGGPFWAHDSIGAPARRQAVEKIQKHTDPLRRMVIERMSALTKAEKDKASRGMEKIDAVIEWLKRR